MCSVNIRPYAWLDIREVAQLLQISFLGLGKHRILASLLLSKTWDRFFWAIRKQSPRSFLSGSYVRKFFVATGQSGKIVGFVSVWFKGQYHPRMWGLSLLCVSPEYRYRGIGTNLMKAALIYLKRKGVVFVGLGVGDTNVISYRLYKNLGFKTVDSSNGILDMMLKI